LAKKVSGRYKCIAFKGGFHGRSMGALSLTTSKESYRDGIGPLLEGISFFPYPYCYRCPFDESHTDCESACIQALKESTLFNSEVAAVIIEPVLGEGGYSAAPIKFLKTLENICKKHGILLIVDEIQSGIGRTGQWFSFQKAGLSPDIIVSAKGLGSGMPISACIAKKKLMDQWPTGSHGGTYGSNPICCAAASATIDIIHPLLPQIKQLAEIAKTFLHKHLDNHKNVGDIRVEGLMIGLELVKDKTSKDPNPEMLSDILKKALEKHVIVLSCGIHSNVLRLAPPLIISEAELLEGLSILCECIHDYH
jgi:4-aminobutyrate aminotransferase-like enzyme